MKYMLAAFAFVAAVGCSHEPDAIVVEPQKPVIASHNDVMVNALTENETFSITWSTARTGKDTRYVVSADAGQGYQELGTTTECHYSTTNAELFSAFGISTKGTYDINFKVEAQSYNGYFASEPVAVKFIYDKIAYLYMLGAYQGWSNENPCSRLLQGSDGIFRGFLNATESEFKICTQYGWDGTNYGWADGAISADGGAGNISLEKGLYYLEFDAENLALVAIPATHVGLIGEAVGGWDKDYAYMEYDAASNSWLGAANVVEGKEYKVRFNEAWNVVVDGKEYDFSLGGDMKDLAFKGSNLKAEGSGIFNFRLSIFDYPYTISTEEMSEKDDVLYVVENGDYTNAAAMQGLWNGDSFTNTYCGMLDMDADGEYIYARLRSALGTRFGGSAAALIAYAGGQDAEGIAANKGLHYVYADLNNNKSTVININSVGLVGTLNGWNAGAPIEFAYDAASKSYKAEANVAADGEFKIVMNKMWNTQVGGVEHQMSLGGSCTDIKINGGNLFITAGHHTFELTFGKIMTLAIDGKVADLSANPDYLEVTGAFAHYNWNLGDPTPALNPFKGEAGRFGGVVDMYQPEGSEATEAEFKITYPGFSTWLGGTLQEGTTYVYDVSAAAGDNMKIPFGPYFWDVKLDAQVKTAVANAIPLTQIALIGNVNGSSWDADLDLTAQGAGIYTGEATINPEFKVRFNGGWDYNLGLAAGVEFALDTELALAPDGGNLKVSEAGDYTITLNLAKSPCTMTVSKK